MDKFCNVCGNIIPQDSSVCPVCDTPVQLRPTVPHKKQIWKRNIVALILIALFVVVCLCVVNLIESNSDSGFLAPSETMDAESAVKGYFRALFDDCDYDEFIEYIYEDELEAKCDKEGITASEFESSIKTMMQGVENAKENGAKIEYEVLNKDGFDSSDVDEIIEMYEDEYDIEVDDARQFKVKSSVSGTDNDINQTETATVVKIGGKWYVSLKE